MKTTVIIGLLLALGSSSFVSNASADLPTPGLYKGVLTITKTMKNRPLAEGPPVIVKTVVKASARVDAEGFIRVVYADDREPILGVFTENESDMFFASSGNIPVSYDARTIEFDGTSTSKDFFTATLDPVAFTIEVTTKLKRVGK